MKTNILAAALALPDRELLARIGAIVLKEREATAELVAHLAALESRPGVYAAQGYGSLFDYCVGALGLSEDAACNRIEAARACRRFPVIVDFLAAGRLTLTSVRKLRNHLTPENHEAVLKKAANRTKEQIEALIAELAPKPDIPASVRKLAAANLTVKVERASESWSEGTQPSLLDSTSRPSAAVPMPRASQPEVPPAAEPGDPRDGPLRSADLVAPAVSRGPRPIVQALAPQRYRVQFTIGQETHDRLRRVQALMRRQIPDGDPGVLFDRALRLLEEAERKKRGFAAKPSQPRSQEAARSAEARNYENRIRSGTDKAHGAAGKHGPSRHIPSEIKRAVWRRDGGQCAFVSDAGHRCAERSFLELHHIQPYAMHGPPTVANISLRCRRHNQYEAEIVFEARETITRQWEGKVT